MPKNLWNLLGWTWLFFWAYFCISLFLSKNLRVAKRLPLVQVDRWRCGAQGDRTDHPRRCGLWSRWGNGATVFVLARTAHRTVEKVGFFEKPGESFHDKSSGTKGQYFFHSGMPWIRAEWQPTCLQILLGDVVQYMPGLGRHIGTTSRVVWTAPQNGANHDMAIFKRGIWGGARQISIYSKAPWSAPRMVRMMRPIEHQPVHQKLVGPQFQDIPIRVDHIKLGIRSSSWCIITQLRGRKKAPSCARFWRWWFRTPTLAASHNVSRPDNSQSDLICTCFEVGKSCGSRMFIHFWFWILGSKFWFEFSVPLSQKSKPSGSTPGRWRRWEAGLLLHLFNRWGVVVWPNNGKLLSLKKWMFYLFKDTYVWSVETKILTKHLHNVTGATNLAKDPVRLAEGAAPAFQVLERWSENDPKN